MSVSAFNLRLLATAGVLAVAASASATTLQQLPKGAHAGECFSHTVTPPTWRTDRIAVPQPPLVSWRDIPAVYNTVSKQVLVAPGRVDHQTIPAVTGTRIKWIEHPGADRLVEVAPVYRWVEKRVLVSPAHLVWRRGGAPRGYGDGGGYGQSISVSPTGEVMCRVLIPARYAVRRVRVLATPARTCVVKGPSTHERIVEHFMVAPARVIDHPVAPVYRTVTERVLVTPGRRVRIETPQPPRYVEKRVEVTPAHTGWTRIDCAPPRAHPVYGVRRAPPPAYGSQPAQPQMAQPQMAQPQPAYGQPAYTPDYARPHPGQLEGAPSQPSYHAPQPGEG